MPIPEGYLPRKGDVVVVRAEVRYDVKPSEDTDADGVQVFVRPLEGYTDVRVPVKTLVGLWSRRFDEGDQVRPIVEPAVSGTVVATSDDSVWVKIDATETIPEHFETYRSENLKPIDPVEEPPVEPLAPMRFSLNDDAMLVRAPKDPLRAEGIIRYLGSRVKITYAEAGELYKVAVRGTAAEFFVSDDMLDPIHSTSRA